MVLCAARSSGISTKPKPRPAAGLAVGHDPDRLDSAIGFEELAEVLLRRGKSQVAHKHGHAWFSRVRAQTGAPVSHRLPTSPGCATARRGPKDGVRHHARKRAGPHELRVSGRRKTPTETCPTGRPPVGSHVSGTFTAGRWYPAGAVWGGRRAVAERLSPADDAREAAGWAAGRPRPAPAPGAPGPPHYRPRRLQGLQRL